MAAIRVVAAETLGHYADWLGASAARLRALNHLRGRTPVVMGRRLKLNSRNAHRQQFEQRRRDYHERLEAAYFASHRIGGTEIYLARRGDSLWNITQAEHGAAGVAAAAVQPGSRFRQSQARYADLAAESRGYVDLVKRVRVSAVPVSPPLRGMPIIRFMSWQPRAGLQRLQVSGLWLLLLAAPMVLAGPGSGNDAADGAMPPATNVITGTDSGRSPSVAAPARNFTGRSCRSPMR